MANNTLPAEVQEQINLKAEHEAALHFHPQHSRDANTACQICYRNGAKEYVTELQECDKANRVLEEKNRGLQEQLKEMHQEIASLTRWKQEATAILNPLWDYAEENLDVQLGKSKTEAILKHINEAEELLVEVFQKHESGLLPDRFIYEKIKKFLYGE